MPTILHTHPISQYNPIRATSNHNIILLIPRNALDLARMARESHARWVLPSVEFENVQQVAGSRRQVLTAVGEFHVCAVAEGVYVFVV